MMTWNEQTSRSVGTTAGRLLNARRLRAAENWLSLVIGGKSVPKANASRYARLLLETVWEMRRVAASALTQRPNRPSKGRV